jgi:ribosomal protein S18 acetylase RimI-like enzyme
MDRSFSIRPASANDIPAVAGLFRTYADALGVDLAYQGFAAELASLPGTYAPPAGALLIAVSAAGDPLGCVAVRPLAEPGVCEMKRLHTLPAARGGGIGRALAIAAMEAATEAGYVTLRLDTLPTMIAAQALYRQLGFEITPPYYDSPVPGTIFMRKILRTVRTRNPRPPSIGSRYASVFRPTSARTAASIAPRLFGSTLNRSGRSNKFAISGGSAGRCPVARSIASGNFAG